ncbi:hypothetical protein CSIM01_06107 [Colletotrichum simmondsii]|uniref:Uncharacterized protein n=1 Tax=Colletotrichum simmondsii TaxID=703756 RepID=A0A135SSS0_9PEZI|nr:hypothetical protein CSIM01_06107 [Colletotrichum simmondsii]
MGATNEDAHALSTAATKPSAMTALPRLNKAATLPFELVLNIMDHAILEAESDDSLELDWYIYDNDRQALGISFGYADLDMKHLDALQRRYTGIRTLLQTNRKIRSMVLGKFYFLYPPPLGETGSFYYILINPKKDLFEIDDQSTWDVIGHPGATLKPLVERLSNVYIGRNFFRPSNSNAIAILRSLPSLRRVDLNIGRKRYLKLDRDPPLVELEVGSGNWKIHAGLFPDLAEWAESYRSTFPTIWQPFKERGVGLLCLLIVMSPTWTVTKEVWLNTCSDGICMNLCEGLDYYYCD